MGRHQNGIHWELAADFEPLWSAVQESPGETIKSTTRGSVTRHRVNQRVYYVKRYVHQRSWFEPAKFYFKPSAGRREWQLAKPLSLLGIPVVPHCAYGERWGWRGLRETFLITEGPEGFVDLNETKAARESNVQWALGRFVRRMHDAAVFHKDLQAANLLYSPATRQFCLVDIERVWLKSKLSQEDRIKNLATLNRRLTLTPHFYEGYGKEFSRHATDVARLSEALFYAAVPKYVRLSLRTGQTFAARRYGQLEWQVRLPALDDNLREILINPDEFLSQKARLLKNGKSATIGARSGLVLKRSNPRKWWNFIIDLFRRSRGRQAFLKVRHLELLGIPAPKPVATADRRRFGLPGYSYFVMEEIPGPVEVADWPGDKRKAIEEVASLIANLHRQGFIHRDWKESNLLFDASGKPYLIDLDGLRFLKKTSHQRAANDIARLAFGMTELPFRTWHNGRKARLTNSDRLRFIKIYSGQNNRQTWRWWWRQIDRRIHVMVKRRRRRTGPIGKPKPRAEPTMLKL